MTPRFTRAMFVYLCKWRSGVRQQRDGAADVTLVDQARAARAQLALGLARLVAEVVPPASGIGLEPLGGLAQTLRRRPVRLQLGHDSNSNFLATFRKIRDTISWTRSRADAANPEGRAT